MFQNKWKAMKGGMASLDTICNVLVQMIFTFHEACYSPFPSRLRMILAWRELRTNRKQQIKYLFKNYEVLKKSRRFIKKYGSSHSTRTQMTILSAINSWIFFLIVIKRYIKMNSYFFFSVWKIRSAKNQIEKTCI